MQAGPFDLQERLGQGGHGAVWRATHVRTGTPVALKIVAADPTRRALLREELAATASLAHPGIVQVLDHGILDAPVDDLPAGSSWLALELADLGDAASLLAPWPWRELEHLLVSVLEALAHAHARGLLHLDIKPGNVVLARAGRLPSVRITDFGMARVWGELGEPSLGIGGTPRYMAPEQRRGAWPTLGPPADLYALGVMAWELALGWPPFTGSAEDLARAHAFSPAPLLPPLPGYPAGLEGWLRRLLQKRPEDRFACAADALHALRSLGPLLSQGEAPIQGPMSFGNAPTTFLSDAEATRSTLETWIPSSDERVACNEPLASATEELPPIQHPPVPQDWREPPHTVNLAARRLAASPKMLPLRDPPLVGRGGERDQLWDGLRRVHAEKRPLCVSLEGASGVGVSRLGRWLVERAEATGAAEGWRVRVDDDDPLRELVIRLLRCGPLKPHERKLRVERITGSRGLGRQERESLLALIEGQPMEAVTRHVAVMRLLEVSARPVILWIDDAPDNADAVAFARRVIGRRDLPVLIALGLHDDELPASLLALLEHPRTERVRLGPLPPGEHSRLLRDLLHLESELLDRIEERTCGNPGFLVEVVRDLVARDLLRAGPRGLELAEGTRVELPADSQQAWSRRFQELNARLPAGAREALELAALLGQEVDDAEWAAVVEDQALRRSVQTALIEARVATRTETGWRFVDARSREAARALARDGDRLRAHHERIVRSLPELGMERRAVHLVGAERYEEASGLLVSALWRVGEGGPRGFLALLHALERCVEALDLGPEDPRSLEILRSRAHHQLVQGRLDEAAQVIELLHERACVPRYAAIAERMRVHVAMRRGRFEEAVQACRRALSMFEEGGEDALVARMTLALAELTSRQGRHIEALELAQQATERHRALPAEHPSRASGLADLDHLIGGIAVVLDDLEQGRARLRAALAAHRRLRRHVMEAYALNELAEIERRTGDLAAAARLYGRSVRLAEAIGAETTALRLNLAACELEAGRVAAARVAAEEVRVQVDEVDRRILRRGARAMLLACAAEEEDWEAWDALMDELQAIEQRGGDEDVPRFIEQAAERAAALGQVRRAASAFVLAASDREALQQPDEAATHRARADALAADSGGIGSGIEAAGRESGSR